MQYTHKKTLTDANSPGDAVTSTLLFCFVAIALLLAGCGDDFGGDNSVGDNSVAGSSGCTLTLEELQAIDNINDIPQACLPNLPPPEENLLDRIFVLGTQVDPASGALHIFVNGTDINGDPLQLADFQAAIVSIAGIPVVPALVSVADVADGDNILSLGFATDYSSSISDAELNAVSSLYSLVLDSLSPPNLPLILEGMVINFSSNVEVNQDWTEDIASLHAALQLDNNFPRNNTALYDAIGTMLQRDLLQDDDGLVERCRPAHMQLVFTDGLDNSSVTYTEETLLQIIEDSKTVTIMLGSLYADKDLLVRFAGEQGGFVYAYSQQDIQDVVSKWAASLSHMVKFTLDPASGFDAGNITIELGNEVAAVERPVDGFCESTP